MRIVFKTIAILLMLGFFVLMVWALYDSTFGATGQEMIRQGREIELFCREYEDLPVGELPIRCYKHFDL